MNEITTYTDKPAVPAGEVLIEILDTEGNPTGAYRLSDGETTQAGTTFVTAEDGDHEVTVTVH